jgi:hypothetical protein
MAEVQKKSIADKLQSIGKPWLFLILILCTSVPLFFSGLTVPNEPEQPTIDLYQYLMKIPEGSTLLLESDWTNSTHGESAGQFKAIVRIAIRRKLKLCIYTAADPQAPKVSRDTMRALNAERKAKGEPTYNEWTDWINLGYFPSAEGTAVNMASDIRKAFAGKKAMSPAGHQEDVFQSPVLANIRKVGDFPLLAVITASNTSNVVIERLYGKVKLGMAVTGVMGPETQVYYASGQLVGLSKGLKGVYDLEILMDEGYKAKGIPPGFPGMKNRDQGSTYYPTLHFALTLLILAVVIGNVGMALGRRRG